MSRDDPLSTLPLLPLRDTVFFPGLQLPIAAGRASSLQAVEAALTRPEKDVLIIAQRDAGVESPAQSDLHRVGTRAVIKKFARLPGGVIQVLAEGVERAVLIKLEKMMRMELATPVSIPRCSVLTSVTNRSSPTS